MPVGWFTIFLDTGILEVVIKCHYPIKRRQENIGPPDKCDCNGQRDIELGGEDPKFSGFVFKVGHQRFPIVINMQKQRDEKKKAEIDVDIAPFRFGQSPQLPVRPIGDPSLRYDVENDTGQYH